VAGRFNIEAGDIYREKDARMCGRLVKVKEIGWRHAYVVGCTAAGDETGRRTRVSLAGLESRFERVGGSTVKADLEAAALVRLGEWRDAYRAAEALWASDGEDPPDWNERMSRAHTIMEDAAKNLLAAADALPPREAEGERTEESHGEG
jgi:hypothetical protein